MKKNVKFIIVSSFISFCVSISLASCKKDKDEQLLTVKEKQLTAREWKITDITRPKISNPAQDSSILKSCTSDDRLFFGTNKSFQLKDNTVRCDSTIFFYDNGNWVINTAQDQVQLNGTKRLQKWQIVMLNDSIMKIQWRDSTSSSNNILKTIFLKNK